MGILNEEDLYILRTNDSWVGALSEAMRHGTGFLDNVPGLIKRIIKENMWQKRIVWVLDNELVEFNSFEEFVTTEWPKGLSTGITALKGLCRSDPESIKLIDEVLRQNQKQGESGDLKDNLFDNAKDVKSQTGDSIKSGLRRLRKDRPDLLEDVIAGRKKVHTAMIEAGFMKSVITISSTDPVSAVNTIFEALQEKKVSGEYMTEFIEVLVSRMLSI